MPIIVAPRLCAGLRAIPITLCVMEDTDGVDNEINFVNISSRGGDLGWLEKN